MKRKVNLLAVALARQSGGLQYVGHSRGRGNPHGWWTVPPEQPHPREELRQDQCYKEGHWKNECSQWLRDTHRTPQPEAEARLLKESIGLLKGEVAAERKTSSDWPLLRIMRRTRTDQAPFYWSPRSLWS
jgi:hypothetical protein